MTAPLTSPVIPAPEPTGPVPVPLGWLLEHGSLPVRIRAALELGHPLDDPAALRAAVYAYEPALRLAVSQRRDGTWGGRALTVPRSSDASFDDVGAIPAVRRLVEYGWEGDSPPLANAKRLLFRLLAEDADPSYLFELRSEAGNDEHLVRRGRALLREGAAAALAQLGLEADPRLRGAAVRALDRVCGYLRSVSAASTTEPSNEVLPPNAAPPSAHFLVMLAFMPRFRSEHQDEMTRLLAYVSAAAPSGTPRQLVGGKAIAQPHLVLGDPLAGVSETASLPTTLAWLEVLARLGFLRSNSSWSGLLDRLLDERDTDGVWKGRTSSLPVPTQPWDWPTFPLGDPSSRESRVADVTFRLALIARLAGRQLDLI